MTAADIRKERISAGVIKPAGAPQWFDVPTLRIDDAGRRAVARDHDRCMRTQSRDLALVAPREGRN